jgi:hypothetical protein
MKASILLLGLLAGCNIYQYQDPVYAQHRFDLAVAGLEQDKPLACVSSEGIFWVRGGDWEEIADDYAIVIDSNGTKHILYAQIANPNCTVKD